MDDILKIAETIANKKYDGHLTILKFTTGWKAIFGTPNLDSGDGRNQIRMLPLFLRIKNAVFWLIKHEIRLMN